jgi:hypothetical protein
MKIEIDLDDIFRDEDGNPEESLDESIRRQVVARLTDDYRKRLFARFDDELAAIIQAQIKEALQPHMPSLVDDIMNAEYTPVDGYGRAMAPTNFKGAIIKEISSELKYAPKKYQSEQNAFTTAVKGVVTEQLEAFKKEFTAQIDDTFKRDALAFAVQKLQERLGLQK